VQNVEAMALFTRGVRAAFRALCRAALHFRIAGYQLCAEFHTQRLRAAYRGRVFVSRASVFADPGFYDDVVADSSEWVKWAHRNIAIARSKLARLQ